MPFFRRTARSPSVPAPPTPGITVERRCDACGERSILTERMGGIAIPGDYSAVPIVCIDYRSCLRRTRRGVARVMNNDDERDYEEEAANRALMEEQDDDGEAADELAVIMVTDEPADFDGGYGYDSYFGRAMRKDD